jgi:voltage-gated potassium channel
VEHERWVRLVAILALTLALYFVVPVEERPSGGLALRAGAAFVLLVAIAAVVVVQVRRSAADSDRRIDGLVGAILTVWVFFALAFYVLELRRPGEVAGLETRLDGLYFAATTMLSVGYGDVHAVGQVARALALVQMLFDIVFVAAAGGLIAARVRRVAATRQAGRGDARPEDVG